MKANFVNGLKNGWRNYYYETGIVHSKMYFKNDTAEGIEYQYYENGSLNYRANLSKGKRYGDLYWYFKNGKLDSYAAFDVKEESFCLFEYDQTGKIIGMKGVVISYNIYSLNKKNYSTIVLNDDGYHRDIKYSNIKDLYITVATPPNVDVIVNADINNIHFKNLSIHDNSIKIPNVFMDKGPYKIFIDANMKDKSGKLIKGMKMRRIIHKE
ncbi:MORN repeat variant [mine drainage metagenome]|uniref:MORN repeat variant n=1 Tax=mine drainage metagenome TaxID=410659 RepID=A0A1J5P7Q6_9ZZZZ